MPVSDPDVSRLRLIHDARFLEADRREIALWRDRHNRLGFVYPVAFVRVLGRWKNVILYREIKIDPAPLKMRNPYLYESVPCIPGRSKRRPTLMRLSGPSETIFTDPVTASPRLRVESVTSPKGCNPPCRVRAVLGDL